MWLLSDPGDAEKFRAHFGGEVFDPTRRARGKRWYLPKAPKG
jgi:hypothetical protein